MVEKDIDKKVQILENWAKSMELTTPQFSTLTGIVDNVVKVTLQEFCSAIINMEHIRFRDYKTELVRDEKDKKGVWSE